MTCEGKYYKLFPHTLLQFKTSLFDFPSIFVEGIATITF